MTGLSIQQGLRRCMERRLIRIQVLQLRYSRVGFGASP